jgi:hypothetical protein
MWKSGGSKPQSETQSLPAPRSRLRGPYRIMLVMAVLAIAVFFIFPLVFEPRIDVPTGIRFGSPSSVPVQISNLNLTPLHDLEYNCALSKLTRNNGTAITGAKVLTRGFIKEIGGRHALTVRCETAYIVTERLQAAEYTLTLNYQTFPWPRQRTSTYRIAAEINSGGEVTGWKSN